MQIIAHYILLQLTLPDCTRQVMEWILEVVGFELVPEALSDPTRVAAFGELDDDERSFSPNLEEVGIDNVHILINMFNPLFFASIYLLQCLVYWILSKVACCDYCKNKGEEHMKAMPGELIRLLLELCLDIGICGLIEMVSRPNTSRMAVGSYFTALVLLAAIVFLLVLGYNVISKNHDKIMDEENHEEFHEKYGALWEDLAISFTRKPWYNIAFMLRRFIYAIVLVLIPAGNGIPTILQF